MHSMPSSQTGFETLPIELATPHDDRGMGQLLRALPTNPALLAARSLLRTRKPIAVCTGFPVNGKPETDGPPGAFAMIDALEKLGKNVKLASWPEALRIFRGVRPDTESIEVPAGAVRTTARVEGHAVLTIEICGLCDDGTYRNMHGCDISSHAPRFEEVFGTTSLVSIGDGGNEFGMGSAPDWFFELRQVRRPVSTSSHLVPAAASNYGAYAVIKELEWATGQRLLPDPDEHLDLIRALVEMGCVDGFTGEAKPAIDGRSLDETRQLLKTLIDDNRKMRRPERASL